MRVIGEEAEKFMSRKIRYIDKPLGRLEVVPDFLPSPDELAIKEENIKITIALSKESVDYFKAEAERHHVKYQRMIRHLLDMYVARQKSLAEEMKNSQVK